MLRPLTLAVALSLPSFAQAQTLRPELVGFETGQVFMAVEFAPGVADSIYVVERSGLIRRFVNGNFDPTPFLDITDRVGVAGEGGFLGLAFHPDFQSNGYFYVSYTTTSAAGDSIVSRFVCDPMTAAVADPMSETILFGPLAQVETGHKSGDLEFGPDGMLYFGIGDGNNSGMVGFDPSQDLSDPRGSILRFDVDAPFPHVPADNPFVGVPGADPLIWGYGLRNPFRFDIDPATGDLYTGDVGAGGFEEVNRLPQGTPGLNFGWRCKEGPDCTAWPGCDCPSTEFRDPIAVLEHLPNSPICAISGGVFIRDGDLPGLDDTFLFVDYCSGNLYAILDPDGAAVLLDLSDDFRTPNGQPIRLVVDFEQAPTGEVYFVTLSNGALWRLFAPDDFGTYCAATPNSTGVGASITTTGSNSISAANLTIEVTDLPANAFGLFLLSRSTIFFPLTGSEGTLCVGPPIFRWGVPSGDSGPLGVITRTTDLTDLPPMVQVHPGETWFFQYWTRDANPTPTSNLSNGASVRFVN